MKRGAAISLLLLGLGCDPFRDPDYYPLELGYRWEYEAKDTEGEFTLVVVVKDTITLAGDYKGWLVENQRLRGADSKYDTSYLYRSDEELRYYPDPKLSPYLKLLALPLRVGERWTVHTDPLLGPVRAEVLSKEEVDIPYGKVGGCFKVQYSYSRGGVSVVLYSWFGPDLGLVRWEEMGGVTSGELKAFKR